MKNCAGSGLWLKRAGTLLFVPEIVGSHWARDVQVDVVAVNWRERAILLGECKWSVDHVGRSVVCELLEEKIPKTLAVLPDRGGGWTVLHMLFARVGFTEAAQAEARAHKMLLTDLATLDEDLHAAVSPS